MVLNQKHCALGDGVFRFNNGLRAASPARLFVAALALGAHAARIEFVRFGSENGTALEGRRTIGTLAR